MNENLIPVLIGAISAGIFSTIGWFVSYFLSKRKEYNLQKRKSILDQFEHQIEELYGPLLGLIRNSRYVFEVSKKLVPYETGKGYLFESFTEHHYKVFSYFTENYFLPNNAKIANLLHTKLALIDTDKIPKSFDEFLKHQAEYECSYHATKLVNNPPNEFVKYLDQDWPIRFEEDVEELLKNIEKRYNDYVKKFRDD
jgi:hypothetical protein